MFRPAPKRSKYTLFHHLPPSVHLVAYATGGLQQLFKIIQNGAVPPLPKFGAYTDDEGCFVPQSGMPLLAYRYQFLHIIGKGQSSILVKAQDTFCSGNLVAIKVLHVHYNRLGTQETDCIRRLNMADPNDSAGTLRLMTTFTIHNHFCMVFELLAPEPLRYYFRGLNSIQAVHSIRKVALRVLQSLGFLQQQNVIHADLKPDNILLSNEKDVASLKVVDFGNAIHCVHEELSLYYDDFELQTLLYRAPEVLLGLPFGVEIDMWSLGCILAELYLNKPLFCGRDKDEVLSEMVETLGPLPEEVFKCGKFYSDLNIFCIAHAEGKSVTTPSLMEKIGCADYAFVDFIRQLLKYKPSERLTVAQAASHPFLAAAIGLAYLAPPKGVSGYPTILLDQQNYGHRPEVAEEKVRRNLTPTKLLYEGTAVNRPASPVIQARVAVKISNYSRNRVHSVASHRPVITKHPVAQYPWEKNRIHLKQDKQRDCQTAMQEVDKAALQCVCEPLLHAQNNRFDNPHSMNERSNTENRVPTTDSQRQTVVQYTWEGNRFKQMQQQVPSHMSNQNHCQIEVHPSLCKTVPENKCQISTETYPMSSDICTFHNATFKIEPQHAAEQNSPEDLSKSKSLRVREEDENVLKRQDPVVLSETDYTKKLNRKRAAKKGKETFSSALVESDAHVEDMPVCLTQKNYQARVSHVPNDQLTSSQVSQDPQVKQENSPERSSSRPSRTKCKQIHRGTGVHHQRERPTEGSYRSLNPSKSESGPPSPDCDSGRKFPHDKPASHKTVSGDNTRILKQPKNRKTNQKVSNNLTVLPSNSRSSLVDRTKELTPERMIKLSTSNNGECFDAAMDDSWSPGSVFLLTDSSDSDVSMDTNVREQDASNCFAQKKDQVEVPCVPDYLRTSSRANHYHEVRQDNSQERSSSRPSRTKFKPINNVAVDIEADSLNSSLNQSNSCKINRVCAASDCGSDDKTALHNIVTSDKTKILKQPKKRKAEKNKLSSTFTVLPGNSKSSHVYKTKDLTPEKVVRSELSATSDGEKCLEGDWSPGGISILKDGNHNDVTMDTVMTEEENSSDMTTSYSHDSLEALDGYESGPVMSPRSGRHCLDSPINHVDVRPKKRMKKDHNLRTRKIPQNWDQDEKKHSNKRLTSRMERQKQCTAGNLNEEIPMSDRNVKIPVRKDKKTTRRKAQSAVEGNGTVSENRVYFQNQENKEYDHGKEKPVTREIDWRVQLSVQRTTDTKSRRRIPRNDIVSVSSQQNTNRSLPKHRGNLSHSAQSANMAIRRSLVMSVRGNELDRNDRTNLLVVSSSEEECMDEGFKDRGGQRDRQ